MKIAEIAPIQRRIYAFLILKAWFPWFLGESLSFISEYEVDIILFIRHKDVVNKQVTSMGYYFRGRGKKCGFHPILAHIWSIFPILGSFLGNYGLLYPINTGEFSSVYEVNNAKY